MDLNEIRIFVKIAQAGSFVQAARQLDIPPSTVSAKLSTLEDRLGVTLIQRTTRKLKLTDAGRAFLARSQRGLDEILIAESEVSQSQDEVKGTLRVTAPVDLGNTCLIGLLTSMKRRYPQVHLEMVFSDEVKDLVSEGIDLAIRTGELRDSGLRAKKLGVATWAPYASARYLKHAGRPRHPKDLLQHPCLRFSPFGSEGWELLSGKKSVTVPIIPVLSANDVNLMKSFVIAGQGIALLPSFTVHTEVGRKELVRILPEWSALTDPIHLVYPDQKFMAPKTRAFIDLAAEEFKSILSAKS